MITLRSYQTEAIEAVFRDWEDKQSTMIVLPTGMGKTSVFTDIIRRKQPLRSIVLVHREELLSQAINRLKHQAGILAQAEMGSFRAHDTFWDKAPVIVATTQTMYSGEEGKERMTRFNPADFGLIVADECFPAGTLIDGRPIESIKPGDVTWSWNHEFHRKEKRRVIRLFKSKPRAMVKVYLSNGCQITCTAGHPFFTQRGYIPAIQLAHSDLCTIISNHGNNELSDLWKKRRNQSKDSSLHKDRESFLRKGLHLGIQKQIVQRNHVANQETDWGSILEQNDVRNESEVCICSHEGKQSDERPQKCRKNGESNEGENISFPWRKREKYDTARSPIKGVESSNGMAYRHCKSEGDSSLNANLLQGGFGRSELQTRNRSRWSNTSSEKVEIFGRQKNSDFECVRVDCVEILEQGSDGRFGQVCPDGFVYNIEVEGNHNYFAEGILVHNCHHYVSKSYRKVLDYFRQNPDLKVLGVTATPDRADEQALGQIFESVAFDYEILDAIHDGWLVPVDQQMVHIEGLDFSQMRTTAGDLNGRDLKEVMEKEEVLHGVASASLEIIGNRRTLAFTASVAHAEMLSNIFNRHKPGMAEWISGKTERENRKDKLKAFKDGKIQVMVNCGVLTEGFDCPEVECVIQARPTKSRSLYAQIIGRSLRPLPGLVDGLESPDERRGAIANSPKKSALIIDFVGNAGRHKLMSSADILGGNVSPEAIERAVKKAEKEGGAVRMDQLLDEEQEALHAEAEARRQAEIARKAKLVAKASFKTTSISPFDAFHLEPVRDRGWDDGKSLSDKQKGILLKMGVNPDDYSYTHAKQLLNHQFHRWKEGLCTMKQASLLQKHGYDTKELKMGEASKLIDSLAKNGWRKPLTVTT